MKKPLLFVPIETKVREYHGKLLFAAIAAERGYDVVFGHQIAMMRWAHAFRRGTYLDKSTTESKIPWFKRCREMGNRIVAWDEEGLVFFNVPTYQKMRLCKPAFMGVDQLYCWGDVQVDAILEWYPDEKERLVKTGNPRFDILRSEFRNVYEDRVSELKKTYGRMILINTNFAFGNHFNGPESVLKQLKRYEMADEPGFFEHWIKSHEAGIQTFLELLPELSRRYPDYTIIIRPHPSEHHNVYEALEAQYPNIKVRADGNAVEWIIASEVLIHYNCTTGIEAYVLQVPSITYRKASDERYEQPLPNDLSFSAFTEDMLFELVERSLGNGEPLPPLHEDPERSALAQKYFGSLGGAYAVDQIVDALDRLPPIKNRNPFDYAQRFARRAYPVVRDMYRDKKNPDTYVQKKFPGMTVDEINHTIKDLQVSTGRLLCVNARKAVPGCFWIESKGRGS
jgi:surface carbohydrate biosynthesis protein